MSVGPRTPGCMLLFRAVCKRATATGAAGFVVDIRDRDEHGQQVDQVQVAAVEMTSNGVPIALAWVNADELDLAADVVEEERRATYKEREHAGYNDYWTSTADHS
jgi:hypothetical protein